MIRLFIVILFYIISTHAFAQKEHASAADVLLGLETLKNSQHIQKTLLFSSSAELGFLYKTGNTNSGDIKTGIDFHIEKDSWLSLLSINLLLKKSDITDENGNTDFKTTDQKWTVSSQSNYKLNNKADNYIYGNIWFEENEFNGFDNQSSISTGWGRHWYRNNNASLWGDIGPGYKRDLHKGSHIQPQRTADTFIIQTQAIYVRKLMEHVEFKQYLSAKQALDTNENSIYKAETTIITKLISMLQLKFTFTADYNTKVEENKKNLDTQTAVALVYNF